MPVCIDLLLLEWVGSPKELGWPTGSLNPRVFLCHHLICVCHPKALEAEGTSMLAEDRRIP